MKQGEQQIARVPGSSDILSEIEKASPSQKREILIRLMGDHPDGLLNLSPHSRAITCGAHLEMVDFRGMNLGHADLRSAILRKADLTGVVLDKANLSGADLAGACMRGASLQSAELQRAMLEDTVLEAVNLRFADLREALLDNANLARADMWGADLERAVLTRANLSEVSFNEANLTRADLSESNLRNAKLDSACLLGANLRAADLTGTQMKGANLREAILVDANLQGLNLLKCDLTNISVAGALLDRTRLSKDQLGDEIGEEQADRFEDAARGYLALERNFAGLGDKDASSWAYRKRRRMEKRFAFAESSANFKHRRWQNAICWQARGTSDFLTEWMCDYGESVPRVLASLLVIYILFTVLYAATGSVVRVAQIQGGQPGHVAASLPEVAIFSLLAMSTSGSPATGVAPSNVLVHLLTGMQALLGIALTGLLGFVLGNRIRR